jgi:hypothetical protein
METKEVSYTHKDGKEYRVVIGDETALARMRRENMRVAAVNTVEKDEDVRILLIVFYPDCISAVTDWCGGKRPTFEEFVELPGAFVDQWASAVWNLIPEWRPASGEKVPEPAPTEEEVKKAQS